MDSRVTSLFGIKLRILEGFGRCFSGGDGVICLAVVSGGYCK